LLAGLGGSRAQRLDAARDVQPGVLEQAIERQVGRTREIAVEPDAARDIRRQDGAMNGGRNIVDEAKPVELDQFLVRRIGEVVAPGELGEGEQPMARRAPLRLHRLGKAREIGGLAAQRRRRDETAEALAAADQALVDENLHRARHGEPADAEALGERRFAVDPIARPLRGDIEPQVVDELQIQRSIDIGVQGDGHSPRRSG